MASGTTTDSPKQEGLQMGKDREPIGKMDQKQFKYDSRAHSSFFLCVEAISPIRADFREGG